MSFRQLTYAELKEEFGELLNVENDTFIDPLPGAPLPLLSRVGDDLLAEYGYELISGFSDKNFIGVIIRYEDGDLSWFAGEVNTVSNIAELVNMQSFIAIILETNREGDWLDCQEAIAKQAKRGQWQGSRYQAFATYASNLYIAGLAPFTGEFDQEDQ